MDVLSLVADYLQDEGFIAASVYKNHAIMQINVYKNWGYAPHTSNSFLAFVDLCVDRRTGNDIICVHQGLNPTMFNPAEPGSFERMAVLLHEFRKKKSYSKTNG